MIVNLPLLESSPQCPVTLRFFLVLLVFWSLWFWIHLLSWTSFKSVSFRQTTTVSPAFGSFPRVITELLLAQLLRTVFREKNHYFLAAPRSVDTLILLQLHLTDYTSIIAEATEFSPFKLALAASIYWHLDRVLSSSTHSWVYANKLMMIHTVYNAPPLFCHNG